VVLRFHHVFIYKETSEHPSIASVVPLSLEAGNQHIKGELTLNTGIPVLSKTPVDIVTTRSRQLTSSKRHAPPQFIWEARREGYDMFHDMFVH
jgi:hypothetical protein